MRKIFLLLSFVTWITSINAEGLKSKDMPSSEMEKQNEQIVKLASAELTKSLPQKVDKYTKLLRVEGQNTTLV